MYLDIVVEILVNGNPVKKYSHEGRTYIQANKGSKYSIKIKNNSYKKRMFCVSVDGINVVDGSAGNSNDGYILNGYSSYEIPGFRTSNEEVHPFKFNDKVASYAAKSEETNGDTSSCGVIGIRVFDEKVVTAPIIIKQNVASNNLSLSPEPTYATSVKNDTLLCCSNFMASSEPESTSVQDWEAGTEFSKETVKNVVHEEHFEVGILYTTIEIFYDYRDGLIKRGVLVIKNAAIPQAFPQAFPSRFCKPPKN